MLTTRFDRMVALNRTLDRMLDSTNNGSTTSFWVPALDVVESGESYLITADLPGVLPEELDISFEQNVLTIRGTKRAAWESKNEQDYRIYTAERVIGGFERAIRLPQFVEGDRIEARFEHGVLTIVVPKAVAAQPRKIAIQGVTEQGRLEVGAEK